MTHTGSETQKMPESLRILCFGDSLTAGYMLTDPEHYPYGDSLQTELAHMLSLPLSKVHVEIDGLSGDEVRGQYMRRMQKRLAKAEGKPYDYIVIMGGTNDLGWGQQPDTIYENLSYRISRFFANEIPEAVWRRALDSSSKVLALNIIETAQTSERMLRKRGDLNKMIADHHENRFYSFDLWSVIRYTGIDEESRDRTWDDGLHLTQSGYQVMGKAIAARLYELIRGSNSEETVQG